ncbi:MAG: hypothetical protein FWG12_07030 [Holophagaceae bacterium]|nr:hypothetical protein [Holophagaceae bacterium]
MHESGTVNHAYSFNIQSTNATGFAITTTSTQPAASAFSSANPTFKPTSEGSYTLYGWANNSTGINANPAATQFTAHKDSPPQLPGSLATASLNVSIDSEDPATITFGDRAPDGHPVTWTGAAKPAGFPGEWSFANGVLTITADEDIEEADYIKDGEAIKFASAATYVETFQGQQVSTATYNFTVSFSANASDKVGGSGGGGVVDPTGYYGQMDYNPGEAQVAIVGIPAWFKFDASVRTPSGSNAGNMPVDWLTYNFVHGTVGLGNWDTLKNVATYRHTNSWVMVGDKKPTSAELGGRFDAWAEHHKNRPNTWQDGTLFFLADKSYLDALPQDMHFGVAALFDNPELVAQDSFRFLQVNPNTPPSVAATGTASITIKVNNENKWDGEYTKEPAIVLRADESLFPGSFDLGAKISFTAKATDADRDDVLTAYLRGVYADHSANEGEDLEKVMAAYETLADGKSNSAATTTINAASGSGIRNITSLLKGQNFFDAKTEEQFKETSSLTWNEKEFSGDIVFTKVPTTSKLTWDSGAGVLGDTHNRLHFVYEVEDMGFNKAYFVVTAGVRGNVAPVLDAFDPEDEDWEISSGDDKIDDGGWISGTASEGSPTNWSIKWSNPTQVPQQYRLADPLAPNQSASDPVYLEMTEHPFQARGDESGTYLTIKPEGELVTASASNTWTIGWNKPMEEDSRKEYSFSFTGWDKYGAAMSEYTMKGLVWGSIYGEPVKKNIYLGEYVPPAAGSPSNTKGTVVPGIASNYADFGNEAWARVKVDFFYGHDAFKGRMDALKENELYNTYTSDLNQPKIGRGGGRLYDLLQDERWSADDVPPVSYLVSADYRDGNNLPVVEPIIGPPVLTTNMTTRGMTDLTNTGVWNGIVDDRETFKWPGGNVAAFAWLSMNSHTPDLSASVGSGLLAGLFDPTLGNYARKQNNATTGFATAYPTAAAMQTNYYNFELGKYAIDDLSKDSLVASTVQHLTYWLDRGTDWIDDMGGKGTGVDVTTISPYTPLYDYTPYFPIYFDDNDPYYEPNTSYTGVMNRIFSGVVLDEATTAIQFSYPTMGQNAFFALRSSALPTFANNNIYPAASYPATPVWSGRLGKATEPYQLDASGLGIYRVSFDVNGIINYQVSDGDPLTLSTMVRKTKGGAADGANKLDGYPYFQMASTGVTWTGDRHQELAEGVGIDLASTNWYPVDDSQTFSLSINRGKYMTSQRYALPYDMAAADFNARVSDTFRVLAYTSGTELGHDDNIHGMPVFLELGNLNAQSTLGVSKTWANTDMRSGNYNFGSFPIPKPDPIYWDAGGDTPVATYLYNYISNPTGLRGSMGFVGEIADGDSLALAPIGAETAGATAKSETGHIRGLRITTTATRRDLPSTSKTHGLFASPTVKSASNNANYAELVARDATEYIVTYNPNAGTGYTSPGQGNFPSSVVEARMHPEYVGGQPKVWLVWDKMPNDDSYSGHIFEFFRVTVVNADGTGNIVPGGEVQDTDLPLYKVFMGKGQTSFPIPDSWLQTLGEDSTNVVIRARTVKYGDVSLGNLVDFDHSPFRRALPATWTDILSTRINFVPAYADQRANPKFIESGWVDNVSSIFWKTPVNAYLPRITNSANTAFLGANDSPLTTTSANPQNFLPSYQMVTTEGQLVSSKSAGGLVPARASIDYTAGGTSWSVNTATSSPSPIAALFVNGPTSGQNPISSIQLSVRDKAGVTAVKGLSNNRVLLQSGTVTYNGKPSAPDSEVQMVVNLNDLTPTSPLNIYRQDVDGNWAITAAAARSYSSASNTSKNPAEILMYYPDDIKDGALNKETWRLRVDGVGIPTGALGNDLYRLEWTIIDAKMAGSSNLTGARDALFGTDDPVYTVALGAHKAFNFNAGDGWKPGDYVTYTVALKSPYSDSLTSAPVVFTATIKDVRDGNVFDKNTKVIFNDVTLSIPILAIGLGAGQEWTYPVYSRNDVDYAEPFTTEPPGLHQDVLTFEGWSVSRASFGPTEPSGATYGNLVTDKAVPYGGGLNLNLPRLFFGSGASPNTDGQKLAVDGTMLLLETNVTGRTKGDLWDTAEEAATILVTLQDWNPSTTFTNNATHATNGRTKSQNMVDFGVIDGIKAITMTDVAGTPNVNSSTNPAGLTSTTWATLQELTEATDGEKDGRYTYTWVLSGGPNAAARQAMGMTLTNTVPVPATSTTGSVLRATEDGAIDAPAWPEFVVVAGTDPQSLVGNYTLMLYIGIRSELSDTYHGSAVSNPWTISVTNSAFTSKTKVNFAAATVDLPALLLAGTTPAVPLGNGNPTTTPSGLQGQIHTSGYSWAVPAGVTLPAGFDFDDGDTKQPKGGVDPINHAVWANGQVISLESKVTSGIAYGSYIDGTPGHVMTEEAAKLNVTVVDLSSATTFDKVTSPGMATLKVDVTDGGVSGDSILGPVQTRIAGEVISWASSAKPEGLGLADLADPAILGTVYGYAWEIGTQPATNKATYTIETGASGANWTGKANVAAIYPTLKATGTPAVSDQIPLTLYITHGDAKAAVDTYVVTVTGAIVTPALTYALTPTEFTAETGDPDSVPPAATGISCVLTNNRATAITMNAASSSEKGWFEADPVPTAAIAGGTSLAPFMIKMTDKGMDNLTTAGKYFDVITVTGSGGATAKITVTLVVEDP